MKTPNKALEPTPTSVTSPAGAGDAPAWLIFDVRLIRARMTNRPRIARAVIISSTIAAATPLIASGCAREVSFSSNQRAAVRQVDALIPHGTSEARAKKSLSECGFHLLRLNPEQAANHLLLATQTKGDITWQIGLVIIDDKVAATSVTILDAAALPK